MCSRSKCRKAVRQKRDKAQRARVAKDSSVSEQQLHSSVAREPVLRKRDKMRRHQKKV